MPLANIINVYDVKDLLFDTVKLIYLELLNFVDIHIDLLKKKNTYILEKTTNGVTYNAKKEIQRKRST